MTIPSIPWLIDSSLQFLPPGITWLSSMCVSSVSVCPNPPLLSLIKIPVIGLKDILWPSMTLSQLEYMQTISPNKVTLIGAGSLCLNMTFGGTQFNPLQSGNKTFPQKSPKHISSHLWSYRLIPLAWGTHIFYGYQEFSGWYMTKVRVKIAREKRGGTYLLNGPQSLPHREKNWEAAI